MTAVALLAPGKRTVTAVLRVMGLSQEPQFQTYHRVLNRARWSSWAMAGVMALSLAWGSVVYLLALRLARWNGAARFCFFALTIAAVWALTRMI